MHADAQDTSTEPLLRDLRYAEDERACTTSIRYPSTD